MVRLLMVGSSASDGCGGGDVPSLFGGSWFGGFCAGLSGGGTTGGSAFGSGGEDGSTRGGGGSATGGWGRVATGPGGRAPGMNKKSSASDDEIQGTCSLRDARVTPTRVRLSVSSAIRSGTRISLSSSPTNRLCSVPLSLMPELSAA